MFDTLTAEATSILHKRFALKDAAVSWTCGRDLEHGDASTAAALQFAKVLKKKPSDIAEVLALELRKHASVEKVEIAGNGYVNVWLTPKALLDEVRTAREACVPKVKTKGDKPVIIEYSQPNIAKPLGVHHIIGTIVGQSIVNLYRHLGFDVISWNYVGDWGTQFGKLAVAYEKWGKKGKAVSSYTLQELLTLYVRFHDEVEKDPTLEDQGREAFRKLEQGDTKLRAFWEDVVTVTKASLADIYRRLQVSFDLDLGESFYEDKMEPVLTEGRKKNVFTAGEGGSLIVAFPEEKSMPPYLVLKGDGATLYSTRDIAQMRYRIDTYHPKEILILTDVAQKLHFEQLVETCRMLGWELPEFENVLFGRMRFVDSAMSTRKGNILNLEQVLDEAVTRADAVIAEHGETIQTDDRGALADMMGVGALVYGILSQNRKMDLVFDWDKMLSFDGNSAPYIQYTYARARSVLRKADVEQDVKVPAIASFSENERMLIHTLLLFPSVLEEALATHMPHKIATFVHQLSQDFNAFYNVDPILKAEEPSRSLRLHLTSSTATVLKTASELLTLRLPERM